MNDEIVKSLTDEKINEILKSSKREKSEKENEETKDGKWKCEFLEWTGTHYHSNAHKHIEIGTVKGEWFFRDNGKRKKTTAKGFKFLEKIE